MDVKGLRCPQRCSDGTAEGFCEPPALCQVEAAEQAAGASNNTCFDPRIPEDGVEVLRCPAELGADRAVA